MIFFSLVLYLSDYRLIVYLCSWRVNKAGDEEPQLWTS